MPVISSSYELWRYQERLEKLEKHQQAKQEANAYFLKVKGSCDDLRARLSKSKEPEFQYPNWLKDYDPNTWCDLPFPPENWITPEMLARAIFQKILLIDALQDKVDFKLTHGVWYVPSSVKYLVLPPTASVSSKRRPQKTGDGIPSLQWVMATHIQTTAEFLETEGTISVKRYDFTQCIRCIPENLGKIYDGPVFWKYQNAFVTPLNLLALLAWEKDELPGVETIKRDKPWTVFRVDRFTDEIRLHDDFVRFIRDMVKKTSLDEALLKRCMCDKETVQLIKTKLEKLQWPGDSATVPGKASEPKTLTGDDYLNVLDNLTHQMGYKDSDAKPAAKFACENNPKETLEKKIIIAVQYLNK